MKSVKEIVHDVANSLSDGATLDDAMHALFVRQKLERSVKAIDEGQVYTQEEVEEFFMGKDGSLREGLNSPAALTRITISADKMNGQPCIREMRLTARRILEALATFQSWQVVVAEFPGIEEEDIRQTLLFAAHRVNDST